MNLKQAIRDKVVELDEQTGNKKAAVEYFSSTVPGLTRQQLNAWMKNGKFPFAMAEALFDQEFIEDDTPPAPPVEAEEIPPVVSEPTRRAPRPPVAYPPNGVEVESEELIDATGATVTPHDFGPMPMKNLQPAGRPPDIQMVEGRTRPGSEFDDTDPQMVETIMRVLQSQGWTPPGHSVERQNLSQPRRPAPPQPPAVPRRMNPRPQPVVPGQRVVRRPGFRQRGWNEPAPAQH